MVKRKAEDADTAIDLNGPSAPSKRKKVVAGDFKPVEAAVLPGDARLDLQDSEIYYVANFVDSKLAKRWFMELLELEAWYQPTLRMYGRSFLQSRQIAAYGSEESPETLKYSGTEVPLQKQHPPILQEIQRYVEDRLQTTFNHCMLNRYDDGSVYIGSHSDNLENLCIASISLGAERDFILLHKKPPPDATTSKYKKRWPLADGSLVIMQGQTQKYWKHEIPKQLRIKQGRISLTFRQLIDK